jgi:integrase
LSEKALVAGARKLFVGKKPLLTFSGERPTPHDLRRTVRTYLGRLGVPRDIAERCLNHVVGEMDSIYDHGDYLPERRDALQRWAVYVEQLIAARGPNGASPARPT